MKKYMRLILFIVCVLSLGLVGCGKKEEVAPSSGEPESQEPANQDHSDSPEVLGKIYENCLKDGSKYLEWKNMLETSYEDTSVSESLNGDKLIISVESKNEYVEEGDFEFIQEGDYLTYKINNMNFTGYMLAEAIKDAVGESLPMDKDIFSSYLNGLQILEINNDYYSEEQGSNDTSYRIYDVGEYDMKEIDEMYVTEDLAKQYLIMGEGDDHFFSLPLGYIRFVAHGNEEKMDMAIGQYDELGELAYKSLVNAITEIKPKGYEEFLANFDDFREFDSPDYHASYQLDDETKDNLGIEGDISKYKFYVIHFGE